MTDNQQPKYTIEQYIHDHDPGLAIMWNESDDQWPGTFTNGVPMTAERWSEWMDKEVTLMRLVVVHEDGPVVGFGSLWDSTDRKGESCYIELLNVHPEHQGRSLCRRMLTDMIDYATDEGYDHITIGTWTANLKAMPLYKKTGFYWRPDTSVYMENYIPFVRRMPILAGFFQQADWYQDYDRVLEQTEDDERHPKTGEMKVYIYRWANRAGETIEAIFDRQSQQLCGLETPDFAVYAQVDETKPAMGLSYNVDWAITNKQPQPMSITIDFSADEGISVETDAPTLVALQANETQVLRSTYCCAPDAPKVEINQWHPKPMPAVRATLQINDADLTLAAGLHYQKPIEVSCHPDVVSALSGQSQRVLVQVQNRLAETVHGRLTLTEEAHDDSNKAIDAEWQNQPFTVEPERFMGIPLTLKSTQLRSSNIQIQATFDHKDQSIQTPLFTLPHLVRTIGGVAALETGQSEEDRHALIENDFFRVTIMRRGGAVRIFSKAGGIHNMYFEDTVGPGFFPFEFGRQHFEMTLHHEGGMATVTTTIASENFPGLAFGRVLTITGSPVIQVQYRLRHTGESTTGESISGELIADSHTCKIMTFNRLLNLGATNGLSTMPLENGLIQSLGSTMPSVDDDFPLKPDGVREEWAAYSSDGQAHGLIWSPTVSEHEWKHWGLELYSAEQTIAPQESVNLDPFYLYCGPGDWRDVRRVWQSMVGESSSPRTLNAFDNNRMPTPIAPHQVRLLPEPLITLNDEVDATLCAENVRAVKLNGEIKIETPAGWTASQSTFEMNGLSAENALEQRLTLTSENGVGAGIGAASGQLHMRTQVADEVTPFTLLRLGDVAHKVTVTEQRVADQTVAGQTVADQTLWQVSNGRMVYNVAPSFHGGVIAWSDIKAGEQNGVSWDEENSAANHLYTSFPDEGAFEWIKPWFGGIRPMFQSTDSAWPGKLHEVTFTTAEVDGPDHRSLPWHGVRLEGHPIEESARGIRIQLEYLTLPGSNVLKLVFRVLNETNIYRRAGVAWPMFSLYCAVDGNMANGTLHADSPYVGAIQRKRSEQNNDFVVPNWGAVENPETGRAIVVVAGERAQRIELNDADKNGGHFFVTNGQDLPPHGVHEMVTYMALAESVEEAKRYGVLSSL